VSQHILTHPDRRLRRIASEIRDVDQTVLDQWRTLETIMRAGPGGVGIAAPQIGINRRLIVIDCRASLRPCRHHGLLYMANPVIESIDGERIGREGCLSVPDWVGMVPRASHIEVTFDDMAGVRRHITTSGFEARVIQHEIDHLDGILFIDRIVSSHDLVRRMSN